MDEGWPQGVGRVVLGETDSTNAEALRRAAATDRPTWFLARRQTAGRGRRGRAWLDPEGNFAATLLTFPQGPLAETAQLSFVAALALADALAAVAGHADRLALKWPNDLLLDGRKLAGILLESEGARPPRPLALAVGIGVNLAHAPDPGSLGPDAAPAVSLREATGADLDPEALLDRLAPAFARWEARWRTEGFAPIREAWLARAAHLGGTITARTGRTARSGVFAGLDPTGALILDTSTGRETIAAADVHFDA